MQTFRSFLPCLTAILALGGGAFAYDPETNENVLVFDAAGNVLKSFHVGDYTTLIDAANIHSEEYSPGSPPNLDSTGTTPYLYMGGERWVPNDLSGQFPVFPSALPEVSLFSFGEALLPSPSSATPGVSLTPGGGAYPHSLQVEVKGFPPSSTVEVYDEGTGMWNIFGNSTSVILIQSRNLQVRSLDGGIYSPIKSVTYTIVQDATADTDFDGIPDLIEVELSMEHPSIPFDPFVPDAGKDSDLDGLPDLDEILRGSDPEGADLDGDGWSDADEVAMGTNPNNPADFPPGPVPVYAPPLLPIDTDGDGWADFDEILRDTLANDASSLPTARWLYEVESIADGGVSGAVVCPTCERHLSVAEVAGAALHSATLVDDTFMGVRTPRGRPSLIRFASKSERVLGALTQIDTSWSARRFLPAVQDPSPGDIDPADWYEAGKGPVDLLANWLAAYEALLDANLLLPAVNVVVSATTTAPAALLDRALTFAECARLGRQPTFEECSGIAGRIGISPSRKAVDALSSRLQIPAQVPDSLLPGETPETFRTQGRRLNALMEDLQALAENTDLQARLLECYAMFAAGQDLEVLIFQKTGNLNLFYPVVLALSLSYQEMMDSGYPLCLLLDPFADLDADMLANFIEALGYNKGRETSIFHPDTDGDGISDTEDNCPTVANGSGDGDSNGAGDSCDPDDDGDGLQDVVEDGLGSNGGVVDTDGDGWPDGAEFLMGLNPVNPNDAILRHETIPSTSAFATEVYPNPVVGAPPFVFANPVTQDSGLSTLANLRTVTNLSFQHRVEKDPGQGGALGPEQISYLVLSHAPSGWNRGRVAVGNAAAHVVFAVPFPFGIKPLVFAMIQSENDPTRTYYPEVTNITNTGFSVRVRANAAQTPPAAYMETVAWVAFLPGTLPVPGEASSAMVSSVSQTIPFSSAFAAPPDILVSLEGVGTQVLVSNATTTGFDARIVNDAVVGGTPAPQRLSWMALGPKACEDPDHDGICSDVDNSPMVYNPDQVDTDMDGIGNVEDVDADNDGLPDIYEIGIADCGFSPFNSDSDGDGIDDGDEDYDGDGFSNEEEVNGGSDPFDPNQGPGDVTPTPSLTATSPFPPTATPTPSITRTPTQTATATRTLSPTITSTPSVTPTQGLIIYNPIYVFEVLFKEPVTPIKLYELAKYWYLPGPTPTPTP
ncbi:MAG: hypothetical protein GHCLOJNM_04561 [bacterium]|nr:hypothetical protein [bacterium]